jgi:hypothetical protein
MKNILEDETKFEEFLNLYKRYFQGRKDVVASYRESNQFRGYTPICNNSLKTGLCRIPDKVKKPCNDCPNKNHAPLDDILLSNHIFGHHILGIYPLLQDNTCWFVAADFDDHDGKRDPLSDVKEFYEVCRADKIPCYVLRSKSGKGYHVYLFFDKPVPAWKARVVALSFLKDAGVTQNNEQLTSFDRLFPNQNKLSGLGFGNLIAYPFQGKAAEKNNTLFLNPETNFENSFSDQLEVLRNISTLSESDLDRFIDERGLGEEKVSSKEIELSPMNHSCGSSGDADKILKCDFIRYCQENQAEVTEPQWLAMISNVSRISPGGLDLCHEYSKDYPGYSRQETEDKIHHAINGSPPITCIHIKDNLFNCGKDCGVKSPINLIFRKSISKKLRDLEEAKQTLGNIIDLSNKDRKSSF